MKPFYINVALLNKEELVASKVSEKAGTGFFGKAASYAATKVVSDDKIINGMSDQIILKITEVTATMGVKASLEKKYQKGPFFVLSGRSSRLNPNSPKKWKDS